MRLMYSYCSYENILYIIYFIVICIMFFRILMCFMCGDSYKVELPLSPLLNHQCCYVAPDKYPTLTLETYLDDSKRRVEITVVPYHTATYLRDLLHHGFVLFYSPKRKASLNNLRWVNTFLAIFIYSIFLLPYFWFWEFL